VAAFELDLEANLWQLAMECFERGLLTETKDMARTTELYYVMCGWDKETGAPTEGKLHELGIGWVAELLWSLKEAYDGR